jgi:branched-chain amino acid transport system substrate-binding protein
MRIAPALLLFVAGAMLGPRPTWGNWGAKPPSSKDTGDGRVLSACCSFPTPTSSPSQRSRPVVHQQREPLDFRGPGRETPEPEVSEVVLGWFGPGDPDHPDYGDFWRGAQLAVEQENAAGGYEGKPFRLAAAWSESPWKAGILDVSRLVNDQHAWAVIGGVDGTTTHLAVQLALKSFFTLLSPGSTDATADHANVPWLFSLPPSYERLAPVIADGVASAAAGGRFAIVAGTDHDSHASLVAVRRALAASRLTPASLVELPQTGIDVQAVVGRLLEVRPGAVLVLAPSTMAGTLVSALRSRGFAGTVLGGATLGGAAFARTAGSAAEGVLAPSWVDTARPQWAAFTQAYAARWHVEPDSAAAEGYDAVRLVAAAIRKAGLNRPRIRDAMRALAPWAGAAGTVAWDALGRNQPTAALGRWTATKNGLEFRRGR